MTKIVTFSILVLYAISLYSVFHITEAQPLNLTGQQNLSRMINTPTNNPTKQLNLKNPFFSCSLSRDQPSDPIEMDYMISQDPNDNGAYIQHIQKIIFKCASNIASVPPPFDRDITLNVFVHMYNSGRLNWAEIATHSCDIDNNGNVSNCLVLGSTPFYEYVSNCTEIQLEHPLALDVLANSSAIKSIFAETHEYQCTVSNVDKLKTVTTFTNLLGNPSLGKNMVVTCIFDVATAAHEGCRYRVDWPGLNGNS